MVGQVSPVLEECGYIHSRNSCQKEYAFFYVVFVVVQSIELLYSVRRETTYLKTESPDTQSLLLANDQSLENREAWTQDIRVAAKMRPGWGVQLLQNTSPMRANWLIEIYYSRTWHICGYIPSNVPYPVPRRWCIEETAFGLLQFGRSSSVVALIVAECPFLNVIFYGTPRLSNHLITATIVWSCNNHDSPGSLNTGSRDRAI
jgi:hypothetical protein